MIWITRLLMMCFLAALGFEKWIIACILFVFWIGFMVYDLSRGDK